MHTNSSKVFHPKMPQNFNKRKLKFAILKKSRQIEPCPVIVEQGCQIFLGPNIPNWKKITIDHKLYQAAKNYTKWP
jgi:hypothetical protein